MAKTHPLHDDALLVRVHFAILIYASHVLVIPLLRLDLVGKPFLEEGGELLVKIVCEC
jgi:hypothetical protein